MELMFLKEIIMVSQNGIDLLELKNLGLLRHS